MKTSTLFGLLVLIFAVCASLDAFIWVAMEGLERPFPPSEIVSRANRFSAETADLNRRVCNVFKQLVARGKMEANDPLFDDCK